MSIAIRRFALAARAGAKEVSGLDSSAPALALAEDGAAANAATGVCRFVKADAMEELNASHRQKKHRHCDLRPPPFVKSRKDIERARAYRRLARLSAR